MKIYRRILTVLVCLTLVLGLALTGFAAAGAPFFSMPAGGKMVTGSGTISKTEATATLTSKNIPFEPIQPDFAYSCHVWIDAYNQSGKRYAGADMEGTVSAYTSCRLEYYTSYVEYTYDFLNYRFGPHELKYS